MRRTSLGLVCIETETRRGYGANSVFLAVLFALLLGALPAGASFDRPRTISPATYQSPSGALVCEVDPSNIYGRGGAHYRLRQNGVVVWEGQKPFTLVQAGVTEDGVVAGFGYSYGENGFSEKGYKDGPGEFVVAMMDKTGALRLHEVVKREQSHYLHCLPNPLARGMVLDGLNNRFIVRVSDPDVNRARESWWTYELSSGKALGKFELSAGDGKTASPIRAMPVTGTPLILVHYWRYESPDANARFALLEPSLKEVWSTTWRRDYNIKGDEAAEDRLRNQIWELGAILNTAQSNRFELFSAKTSQRVSFSVRRGPAGSNDWQVTEVGRSPHQLATAEAAKPIAFRKQPLKLLGTFTLQEKQAAGQEVFRNLLGFGFDDRGRIGLLRRGSDKAYRFAQVKSDGTLLRDTSLVKAVKAGSDVTVRFTWVQGNRWVVTVSELGVEEKSAAFWLDGVTGQLETITGFTCPSVESLVASGDGGFVALVLHHFKYSIEHELIAFSPQGKPRWQIKEDYQNEQKLFSPEDITVTGRGQVAVLDNIRHRIQFYKTNGGYVGSVDLKQAWGRKPNYPIRIAADKDGGVLIQDFQGSPPVVRMDAEGKVVSQFPLKYPDGRALDPTWGVKVSPSGRVWACDGASVVRVTDAGVVDLVLGAAPNNVDLGRVAAVAADQRGRFYAADERTGAVHVFNQDGKRLRVCKPDVADFSRKLTSASLGAAENGEVYVSSGNDSLKPARYLHFAADGKRLGIKEFGLDNVKEHWFPLPTSDRFLVLGYHDAFLVSGEGKVLRKIQRRPDGKWLEHPELASVAPDGSYAIVSGGTLHNSQFFVNLYSPEGDPIRTVVLPPNCQDHCFAYTGKYLATCTESEICLFSPVGEPILAFQPAVENFKEQWWRGFGTQRGRELWLVSAERKQVWRFELP